MRKQTFWFSTWSDTNQAVQLQKMARGLKFRIWKVEGLYYLCSENKGADQLRGYREADLRFFFAYAKCWFSHDAAQICLQCYCYMHGDLVHDVDTPFRLREFAVFRTSLIFQTKFPIKKCQVQSLHRAAMMLTHLFGQKLKYLLNETCYDKTFSLHMRKAKSQISCT